MLTQLHRPVVSERKPFNGGSGAFTIRIVVVRGHHDKIIVMKIVDLLQHVPLPGSRSGIRNVDPHPCPGKIPPVIPHPDPRRVRRTGNLRIPLRNKSIGIDVENPIASVPVDREPAQGVVRAAAFIILEGKRRVAAVFIKALGKGNDSLAVRDKLRPRVG